MSREFSTKIAGTQTRSQQLNTALRRSQQHQADAMIRLAGRHGRNVSNPGLKILIENFQSFARDYAAALDSANQSGHFSFLLRSGIERLLQEWSILSRVCEQRDERDPQYMKVADRKQSMRFRLEQADTILTEYCSRWNPPAQNRAYTSLQTPVVYFEKLYRISRALFAPDIPVVSIPLSDYDAPEHWQALAHEMGHHVFWNGVALDEFSGLQNRLRQAMAQAILTRLGAAVYDDAHPVAEKWLKRVGLWGQWLEEVFADVCGVLFAGPAFAHSAQDLAAASVNTLDDLIGHDNQKYPCLYLRPLISLQVVRVLAQSHPDARYGQALLEWAGAGETTTQLRGSEYEDYLTASQSAGWPRGKRIPADMPASRSLTPSGDLRWHLFTSGAADRVHPAVQVTLADLAADVPVVVETVLHTKVWPDDKCLCDLIEPYGSQPQPTTDKFLQELADLSWQDLPKIPDQHDFPTLPDLETRQADQLTPIMQRIVTGLDAAQAKESERSRIFWTLLSALDIESEAAGYTPHDWASDHRHDIWWFAFTHEHKHNADGSNVIPPW